MTSDHKMKEISWILSLGLLTGCSIVTTDRSELPEPKPGSGTRTSKARQTTEETVLYVAMSNKKFGYIDRAAKIVIDFQFDEASDFVENRAWVKRGGKAGFIDSTGRIIGKMEFQNTDNFAEGIAPVQNRGLWGYVDTAGKIVIDFQFLSAGRFSQGLARVEVAEHKVGYIDKTGKIAIGARFDDGLAFSEELASVRVGSKWGFIGKAGKFVIDPKFDRANGFSEGLASVNVGGDQRLRPMGGTWFYIDRSGTKSIRKAFSDAGDFSEGLAFANLNGKYGYIAKSGDFVIGPKFDPPWSGSDFSEGFALVYVDKRAGYIDRAGNIVISPQFQSGEGFRHGLARVGIADEVGYIDRNGKPVWGLTEYQSWAQVKEIALERTSAFGQDPVYKLILRQDGSAVYKGEHGVERLGQYQGKIDRDQFDRLARLIHAQGFFQKDDYYAEPVDAPTIVTSVVLGGKQKSIVKYEFSCPIELWAIDMAIEGVATQIKWTKSK